MERGTRMQCAGTFHFKGQGLRQRGMGGAGQGRL